MAKNHFPLVMKIITAITAVLTLLFAVIHKISGKPWLLSVAISTGTTCYHFAMRLIVGQIVSLFRPHLRYDSLWFRPHPWESRLYTLLNVHGWKKDLPTYAPEQFDLRHNTLPQIIRNTCNAELVHEVIMLLSFVPIGFVPVFGALPVFLITSVCAALYDSIFVIAQRYNRPRLVRILEKKGAATH